MYLSAEEFIRRFLQHVLPKGFIKVRSYDLFSPGQCHQLKQVRALLEGQRPAEVQPELELGSTELTNSPAQGPPLLCPKCGQLLRWQQQLNPVWPQPP